MENMNKTEKKNAKQKQVTRQLINTKAVTDYSLATNRGDELVYFIIKPTNISVLSEESVSARTAGKILRITSSFSGHGWSRKTTRLCGGFWSRISPSSTGCRCRWRRPENFWW